MAKYSDIKGFTVQTVTSDPAASVVSTGSWATGGSLNSTGHAQSSGSGSYNAALCAGGQGPPSFSPRYIALTEQYNGTSWTEVNDLNTARTNIGGAGTTTAAIATGGTGPASPNSALNESWNGSAWTEVNDLNVGNKQFGMAGTATAAFEVGGNNAITSYVSTHEQWDGTNWTESGDINTARAWGSSFGITTAAIYAGGRTPSSSPSGVGNVESWNGSAWTEVNNLNQARYEAASGSGIQTAGMIFGGYQPPNNLAKTEVFDGTSFTEVGDLGTAVRDAVSANNPSQGTSNALNFGGFSTAYTSVTETWTTTPAALFQKTVQGQLFFNSTTNTFKETILDVPAGTWAGGGALNTARSSAMGAGTQGAGIVTGGYTPSATAVTEQYDGSSWTEVGDLNSASVSGGMAHNSPYADTIKFGGSPDTDKSESWNNSSWTEQGNLNTGRIGGSGYGDSSTSAGYAGGDPVSSNINENWDGSSWTEVNNLNSARRYGVGTGTKTAALVIAGDTDVPGFPGGRYTARVESWDGTSFSEGTDLNTGGAYRGAAGTQTLAIAFGGGAPSPYVAITEAWNGSTWTEVADLSTARRAWASGIGQSATLGMAAGGEGPSAVQSVTEEFTANLANKTITTS